MKVPPRIWLLAITNDLGKTVNNVFLKILQIIKYIFKRFLERAAIASGNPEYLHSKWHTENLTPIISSQKGEIGNIGPLKALAQGPAVVNKCICNILTTYVWEDVLRIILLHFPPLHMHYQPPHKRRKFLIGFWSGPVLRGRCQARLNRTCKWRESEAVWWGRNNNSTNKYHWEDIKHLYLLSTNSNVAMFCLLLQVILYQPFQYFLP